MIGIERHISDKFRDESFADCEVCVVLASHSSQNAQLQEPGEAREELDKFPGHLLVLTRNPYFQTQVNFVRQQEEQRGRDSCVGRRKARSRSWSRSRSRSRSREQRQHPQTDSLQCSTPPSSHSSSSSSNSKMTFVLAVNDRSHAPAATAVIAWLYGVANPTKGLQEEELVYLAQYADMLQVDSLAAEAVAELKSAAALHELSAATMAALAALPSWPSCILSLLPIISKHVTECSSTAVAADADSPDGPKSIPSKDSSIQLLLLAALGDLEAVWQSEELCNVLLELPLPAVQLLLSSNQLQVCFEDTVLLTVVKYLQKQPSNTISRARKQLSALIRAPHLSDLQLAAQAFDCNGPCSLLIKHRRHLQQLQQLRRIEAADEDLPPESVTAWRSQVPSSWLQGARRHLPQPTDGISLTWHVPVEDLKSLVRRCHMLEDHRSLSCTHVTPPLKGLQWQMWASCKWEKNNSVYLGIFYAPLGLPTDMYFKFRYSFESSVGVHVPTTIRAGVGTTGWGLRDFFGLGALPKHPLHAWDHQTWVGKGLPSDGSIKLKLTIYDVW